MFTPQPAVFVDRVLQWIAHRRPATLPAHMLATHTRPSTDSVECVRRRRLSRAGSATSATGTTATSTSTTTSRTAATTSAREDEDGDNDDCAPNPARVADTFDSFRDILEAMNVFGEKYNDDLLASDRMPDL